MRSDDRVQGWFWWMTIAAAGIAFVVALDSARASETPVRSQVTDLPAQARSTGARNVVATSAAPTGRTQQLISTSAPKPVALPSKPLGEPTARGLRRLAAKEVSAEMLVIARRIIREHNRARPGTEIAFESGGQTYVARLERHFHPEGGPVKPWGYHPGVSLLKAR